MKSYGTDIRKQFTREIQFSPAWDKRNPDDPKKNYGIRDVSLRFILHGPLGAVQFVMFTGWQTPKVRQEFEAKEDHRTCFLFPMAADLGYHWKSPRYKGQKPMDHCDVMPDGVCYYDGSGLNAQPVMDAFFTEGEEMVWTMLESYYAGLSEEE